MGEKKSLIIIPAYLDLSINLRIGGAVQTGYKYAE